MLLSVSPDSHGVAVAVAISGSNNSPTATAVAITVVAVAVVVAIAIAVTSDHDNIEKTTRYLIKLGCGQFDRLEDVLHYGHSQSRLRRNAWHGHRIRNHELTGANFFSPPQNHKQWYWKIKPDV
jgi:hypothetical protein